MRIYCSECIYFYIDGSDQEKCENYNNIYCKNTYKEVIKVYKKHPNKLNKKNNCNWYLKKKDK